MSKIKKLKVKISDTEFSDPIAFGADAINISMEDGSNAEEAISKKVNQDFNTINQGDANKIDADSVNGKTLNQLYSEPVILNVPAAYMNPNGDGMYYAQILIPGMTSKKAIIGLQMTYETSIDPSAEIAAYSWEYLETGDGVVTFYGSEIWFSAFSLIGIIIEPKEEEN